MPTYKNNRDALLVVESRHNPLTSTVESRTIKPGEFFIAHSTEIPARWLAQGSPLEGNGPWVTQTSAEPTDEELSG